MIQFLLWCLLLVFCWPLALLALVLYPIVWLLLLPFRLAGIAVHGLLDLVGALIRTCLIKPYLLKFTQCMRLFFRSGPFAGYAGKWAPLRQPRGIVSLEKPQTYPDLMPCTIYETGSTLPARLIRSATRAS